MKFCTSLSSKKIERKITRNEALCLYSSMKVGGAADYFLSADTAEEILAGVEFADEKKLPFLIIGAGSNIVFDDSGFRGLIIKISENFSAFRPLNPSNEYFEFRSAAQAASKLGIVREAFENVSEPELRKLFDSGNFNIFEAEAGLSLKKAALLSCGMSFSGLEFASGIPGSCGGALFMNAGAYGGEISDICLAAQYIDPDKKVKLVFGKKQDYGYRKSVFRQNSYIVLRAFFVLRKSEKNKISGKISELSAKRETTQPLEFPSCGSVFKRPDGYFAGKLIMDSGMQGRSIGGAEVSEKHAGFIINKGGASAADIKALVSEIIEAVYKKSGVKLEPEIRIIDPYGKPVF